NVNVRQRLSASTGRREDAREIYDQIADIRHFGYRKDHRCGRVEMNGIELDRFVTLLAGRVDVEDLLHRRGVRCQRQVDLRRELAVGDLDVLLKTHRVVQRVDEFRELSFLGVDRDRDSPGGAGGFVLRDALERLLRRLTA